MPSSVTQTRSAASDRTPSRLNWGLILVMSANAVLVVGIVMLIKAILTLGITRLLGLG